MIIGPPPVIETIRLYYFTTKQWGLKALWEKRLKVSRYSDVNDPFELSPFDRSDSASDAIWRRQAQRLLEGSHGLLCFSDSWQTPQLWTQYSAKHTGLCLGFDVPRHFAEPVVYIDRPLSEPSDRDVLARLDDHVLEAALRYKHRGWSHEREWRLRVSMVEHADGISFKRFDDDLHLREVIVGSGCSLEPIDVIEAVALPPLDVDIFKATPSRDAFEMRKHETAATHTAKGFRATIAMAPAAYADELPEDDSNLIG